MSEADRIIDALGGTQKTAELFEVKPPSVSEWRVNGIPRARMQTIRLLRPDLFQPAADRAASAGAELSV